MVKFIVCSSCGKLRKHNAKNLCNTCYRRRLLLINPEYKARQYAVSKKLNAIADKTIKNSKQKIRYHTAMQRIRRYYRDIIRKSALYSVEPEAILLGFEMGCSICGSVDDLAIDHDHATGVFRGILCRKHNLALGLLGDTLAGVKLAVTYLEQNNASNETTFIGEVRRPRDFITERY